MNIKINDLITMKQLPFSFSSPQERQEYYSMILHNISMLEIQNNPNTIKKVIKELNDWREKEEISENLYNDWTLKINEIKINPEKLIEKTDKMQQLRSISPFYIIKKDDNLKKEILNKLFKIKKLSQSNITKKVPLLSYK